MSSATQLSLSADPLSRLHRALAAGPARPLTVPFACNLGSLTRRFCRLGKRSDAARMHVSPIHLPDIELCHHSMHHPDITRFTAGRQIARPCLTYSSVS